MIANKQNIAIILEFGFHEIKKYIHSGFAEKLNKQFNIYWFAINKQDKEFHNYFSKIGQKIIYINTSKLNNPNPKTESRNQSVRRAWITNKKLGQFHNYKKISGNSFKTKLIGNTLFKRYYERKTLRFVTKNYVNNYFVELFERHKIDCILFTSYNSVFVKTAVITAQKTQLKTWYLINSWKDLFTNNFVPFTNLNGIFGWSAQMKKDYLYQCNYLKKTPFYVTGNPTFDVLLDYQPKQSLSYYAKKYNFNKDTKLAYYTMMPPGLVNDEIETLILTAKELLKKYTKEEMVILLRRNPNHNKTDFCNLQLPENLILTEHFTTYDKEKDLIIQSPEGEQEWLDLLNYTQVNLSVPSTVTLEFLALNKPVVNIAYGSNGALDNRIQQHFNAGFYKPLFKNSNLVYKITSINNINPLFSNIFKDSINSKFKTNKFASKNIINYLLK